MGSYGEIVKRLLSLFAFLPLIAFGDRVVLCGASQIFMVDPGAQPPVKTWTWQAKDHPELPANLVKTFATTDDCKPIDGGKRLLVTSSSGGCALLELPSGKPVWWARVTSAHSIEALPGGRIVVAASAGNTGNKLVVFDAKLGDKILWEGPLPSAHGVVWDEKRQRLWALGFEELRSYSLKDWDTATPSLVLEKSHPLPDKDGHDLRPVPKSPDMVISTHANVWLFDRETSAFRIHGELKDRAIVKCVDPHPETGRLLVVQASEKNWWSDSFEFLNPEGKRTMKGERLYKGRWLVEP